MKAIEEIASSGGRLNVVTFDAPLTEPEMSTVVSEPDEPNILDVHGERYSNSIKYPHLKEMLLALEGRGPEEHDIEIDPWNLSFLTTTSYHYQAVMAGNAADITPTGIHCVVRTFDSKLVHGIRGGDILTGMLCTAPAGKIPAFKGRLTDDLIKPHSIPHGYDPVFSAVFQELLLELGIARYEVDHPKLLGYVLQDIDHGKSSEMPFVLTCLCNLHSREIVERHKEAIAVYNEAINRGVDEYDARLLIGYRGFPNTDAWEHERLVMIENDTNVINEITRNRKYVDGFGEFDIVDNTHGSLVVYANSI